MENKSLFHIKNEYLELLNKIDFETGDIPQDVSDALAINEEEAITKSESYVSIIKKLEADFEMFKQYEDQAKKLKDQAKKRIDYLKANLKTAVDLYGQIQTPLYKIGLRASESVILTNEAIIPPEYYTLEKKFDKNLIKAVIKKGESVPGAEIKSNENLSIK